MLAKMRRVGPFCRAALLLGRGYLSCPKVGGRLLMTDSFPGVGGQILFTSSANLTDSAATADVNEPPQESIAISKLDRKLAMYRLRNNFSRPGRGLSDPRNRNSLVSEFYDLSKSVIDGCISVEEFEASKTFSDLQEQLDLYIDILSNAQVVNILASLIKMRIKPSTSIVKLLEHEVKFRINSLSLNQVIKLIKFYNGTEMSYEHRQITDLLNNRIRACLHNKRSTVIELVEVLSHLNTQQASSTLLSLVEESLLNALTEDTAQNDDMVSVYLPKTVNYDYNSLCNLFVEFAANRRRPTPILKAASNALSKLPFPREKENQPNVLTLITTLNALISLSYPYRLLVSKLVNDLTENINLSDLDTITQCNLLRAIGGLRWRPLNLLRMFYNYVETNHHDPKRVDHNLILTLIHITAQLNYKPDVDLREFYRKCMTDYREQMIDKRSRKWLNHVWSLAMLDIADESHIRSVLSDEFIQCIEIPSSLCGVNHADMMKLLNLRSIAKLEHKLDVESKNLDELSHKKIQRGADLQKFASKIRDTLNGIAHSASEMRYDIHTPFGFVVDCEILLDENSNLIPLDKSRSLEETIRLAENGESVKKDSDGQNCALIYVLFDETIANTPNEVIGHKQMIHRILKNIGYETIFLPENLLSREKTSADLSNKIKEVIRNTTSGSNQAR